MLTTKEKNITWSSSADTKKVLKFNSFLIKILNNLEIKRKVLHEIKHIYKKPIANITFHVERQCFPYKTGNRQNVSSHNSKCLFSPHCTRNPRQCNKTKEEARGQKERSYN